MKDFMLAILEDNSKAQRTVGLHDMDMIEVYEQSIEIMAFEESL